MFAGDETYAIRWVPPAWDPLATFGHAWTGWCAETGEKYPRLASPAEGLDLVALTRDISRWGVHAVLVPRFRLDDTRGTWGLERRLGLAADRLREIAFRGLELAVVDGRVALVPPAPADELDELARRLRAAVAPLSSTRSIREPGPSVRFHLPITDPLPTESARQIAARLRPLVADLLRARHVVGEVALMVDPGNGRRARVTERYVLADEVSRGRSYACRGPRVHAPLTQFHPAEV